MLSVTKEFNFCASHKLPGHETCGKWHGHNYQVVVSVSSNQDNLDMVIDFYELKKIVGPVLEVLDHDILNKVITYPSAENIAKYIYHHIHPHINSINHPHRYLDYVAVYETGTSCAIYRE